MMPGSCAFPVMVCVFPDDVCPYANTVPLNPRTTDSATCFARTRYTSSFDDEGGKTHSNAKSCLSCGDNREDTS